MFPSDSSGQILCLPGNSLQQSGEESLSSLPAEILLAIFSRAALFDRCALALTCKFFAEIAVASDLLRYRTPTHDDMLHYQQTYHSRSWGLRVAVRDSPVKHGHCDPFPELAVPPQWFRVRFCQGCRHCQSHFVPKWPYIDCAWDARSSSSVVMASGQDVTERKKTAKGGCKLHPHIPRSASRGTSFYRDDG
jgi:F-box-like